MDGERLAIPHASAPAALSRRSVLFGGAGVGLLAACGGGLAACGGGSKGDAAATTGPVEDGRSGMSLVAFFDGANSLIAGRPQRATFGLGDDNGNLIKDAPASLDFQLYDDHERAIGRPVTVERHDDGLPRAYFPFTFTPAKAGVHGVRTVVKGATVSAAFDVATAATVKVPGVGDALPVVDSPTTADARGLDPICTQEPVCPLHEMNLRDALSAGKPIALLVSTPAYCQTAICGPVLDLVIAKQPRFIDRVTFLHAEVYRSATDVEENGTSARTAPVVEALGLPFEPCLLLIAASGKVASRLDVIFDSVELEQGLQLLTR